MEKLIFIAAPQGRKFLQTTIFGSEYFTEVLVLEYELLDSVAVIQQIHRQMWQYIENGALDSFTGESLMKSIVGKFAKGVNPRQLFYVWHNLKQSLSVDKYMFESGYVGLYQ